MSISTDAAGVLSLDELNGDIIAAGDVPAIQNPGLNWILITIKNNTQWSMNTNVPVATQAGVYAVGLTPPSQIAPFSQGSILATGSNLAKGAVPYTLLLGTTPATFTFAWSATTGLYQASIVPGTGNPVYTATGSPLGDFSPVVTYTGKDKNNNNASFKFQYAITVGASGADKQAFVVTLQEALV